MYVYFFCKAHVFAVCKASLLTLPHSCELDYDKFICTVKALIKLLLNNYDSQRHLIWSEKITSSP